MGNEAVDVVMESTSKPRPPKKRQQRCQRCSIAKITEEPALAIPLTTASSSPILSPELINTTANSKTTLPSAANPETKPPHDTDPLLPLPPSSTIQASQIEAEQAQTRRTVLKHLQASSYARLAGTSEPNLNDHHEVRHFEVDSHGSLTFILLDGGEAWRLREVGLDCGERGQMVMGRFYVVERV